MFSNPFPAIFREKFPSGLLADTCANVCVEYTKGIFSNKIFLSKAKITIKHKINDNLTIVVMGNAELVIDAEVGKNVRIVLFENGSLRFKSKPSAECLQTIENYGSKPVSLSSRIVAP